MRKVGKEVSEEIIAKFNSEIIPSFKDELSSILRLDQRGVRQFPSAANSLLGRAIAQLLLMSDKTSIEEVNEIDPYLSLSVIFLTITSLNGVLPLDYPFIIVAVECLEDKQWRFIVLVRNKIPGMHDNLNAYLLPILCVKKFEDLYAEDFYINNVRYESRPDDLPDIFKN